MSTDPAALNQARIDARRAEWERAGRELYKEHARGVTNINPGDIISRTENQTEETK